MTAAVLGAGSGDKIKTGRFLVYWEAKLTDLEDGVGMEGEGEKGGTGTSQTVTFCYWMSCSSIY